MKNKYQELTGLKIVDIDHQGRGTVEREGRQVLVENALPGEVVDAKVVKKDRGILIARPFQFHQLSPVRKQARCVHFGVCGGCKWQNVDYAAQLEYKTRFVEYAFKELKPGSYPAIRPILGSEQQYYYRNKMEFSFGNRRWLMPEEISSEPIADMNALGLHPAGAFDKVLDLKECFLQPEPSNTIRLWVKRFAEENQYPFFDLRNQQGLLRNLTIRTTTTGELLVIVSLFYENEALRIKLLDALLTAFPVITSLHYVINAGKNDVIYEHDVLLYHGAPFIRENLHGLVFKIGPKSFFQVNVPQAQRLFDIVFDFAALTGSEMVYDLYTGIGSIALCAATKCKQVIGIETVPEAIADAEENARLNNITNCQFIAGDMKDILTPEYLKANTPPDLIITDPPRAGMHPLVTKSILHAETPRVVYVSCNPVTQARDLLVLAEKYTITAIQPVDMFPQTYHVENVVKLDLK